jgi:hypothetical protein
MSKKWQAGQHKCPLCGRKHDTYADKEICFDLCTKLLEAGKPLYKEKRLTKVK